MVKILMMSAKIATQPFSNERYFEIKVITSYILSMTSPAIRNVEITGEKLVGGPFCTPPPLPS